MKAFISYSIGDEDQMVITLLSNRLRNQGFQILTSQNFYSRELDFTTKGQVNNSSIFFGVITAYGQEKARVLEEWNYSKSINIPNILLIEDIVNLNSDFKGNYLVFNRNNPQKAIDEITNKINNSESKGNKSIWPWLIGGAALLGIINLLSKDE